MCDFSKLKAFADDKIKETEKLKFVLGSTENIAGKGENAGYQHFLCFVTSIFSFSYNVFKTFFFMVVKSRDCMVKSYGYGISILIFQVRSKREVNR